MLPFIGKREQTRKRYRDTMHAVIKVFSISDAIAGGKNLEDESGNINRKALGYIYGFTDAALQRRGLSIDNEDGYTIILGVLNSLYEGRASKYFTFLAEHLKDPETTGGIFYGGQQYNEWLNSDGKKIPLGFGLSLLGG